MLSDSEEDEEGRRGGVIWELRMVPFLSVREGSVREGFCMRKWTACDAKLLVALCYDKKLFVDM